jgi:hypothetical protein
MAPPRTPTKPKRREYGTVRRARFFDAYFKKQKRTSLGQICRRKGIKILTSTARTWIRKHEILGSPSIRYIRGSSKQLGRPKKLDVKQLLPILDLSYPSHDLRYPQMAKKEGF